MSNSSDSIILIDKLKEKYGIDKTNKMLSYIDMVLERNNHINLTAVRDRDEALHKHIEDSLSPADYEEYINASNIIDVGTGAGFPGAILAIANEDKKFTLLDSTLKRLKVIDEFADVLDINNIVTKHARAEELSKHSDYKESFDVCVSRAVAGLDKLCAWCLPFVRKGGTFVSYKGESYKEEINQAAGALKRFKGRLDRIESYPEEPEEISGHVLLVISK
jgi:16S rRNA (guanine527-N7)-methyltransferase